MRVVVSFVSPFSVSSSSSGPETSTGVYDARASSRANGFVPERPSTSKRGRVLSP